MNYIGKKYLTDIDKSNTDIQTKDGVVIAEHVPVEIEKGSTFTIVTNPFKDVYKEQILECVNIKSDKTGHIYKALFFEKNVQIYCKGLHYRMDALTRVRVINVKAERVVVLAGRNRDRREDDASWEIVTNPYMTFMLVFGNMWVIDIKSSLTGNIYQVMFLEDHIEEYSISGNILDREFCKKVAKILPEDIIYEECQNRKKKKDKVLTKISDLQKQLDELKASL